MLEFENQMLLDLLHEDGLLISARGLGIERLLINLLRSYSDSGNLVLVIGTTHQEEQYFISQLEDFDVSPLPKSITTECSVNERTQLYLNGGCLFVTSRILVVDLLKERVPINLVTGLIVWKAHKIIESCQEAFILRLFRQRNKVGFIKALSCSALSFTIGFCHVERVMKNLFVKKLYLWPRFHLEVNECLSKCKPEVIELHLEMTNSMQQIQMNILDLITTTLQELKLSNRSIDIDDFCTENAISKSFELILKLKLDPVWHQLSSRTKQLVADLKVIRTILMYLSQYDCITFYNLVNSLQTTEKAMQSAGWMLLGAADSLFHQAKLRVFGGGSGGLPPCKKVKVKDCEEGDENPIKKKDIEPNPEVNPKWLALSEVLDEVKKEQIKANKVAKCLVVTQDDRTSKQLTEYLVDGSRKVLLRTFYRTLGPTLGLLAPLDLYGENLSSNKDNVKKNDKRVGVKGRKTSENNDEDKKKEKEEISLTQITKKYNFIGDTSINEEENLKEMEISKEASESIRPINNLLILVQSLKNYNEPYSMTKLLEEIQPKYIVIYDSDLAFIRHVELWQAGIAAFTCRVYFLIYKGTVEEQIYLTSIKREKTAFEYLIKAKASMVLPEYTEGRSDDHPDLMRDHQKEDDITGSQNEKTRKGGQIIRQPVAQQKIIVDMREFRSELPSIIHRKGIDIEPATIEVGDYILTPDICVERKSISDLIGSLNNGRLYNQAVAMTRYYKKPILLIEFDHNKPFHLQGRLFLSSDISCSSSAKDVSAKLQLLTLHFPMLRLLWCPSPYSTVELFQMLKAGKPEPSVEEAQAVTADSEFDYSMEKFNPLIKDFLLKLPGVTSKNIFPLMRNITDLPHLLKLSEEEIAELIENPKSAKELYSALHDQMKEVPTTLEAGRYKTKTKFGKKTTVKKFR